jgi:hypothetical protein
VELVGSIVTRVQDNCLLDGEGEADGEHLDEFGHGVRCAHV